MDSRCMELLSAVKSGDCSAVRKLLAAGISVSSRYERSRTPLHMAVVYGQEEVAKIILMNTPKHLLNLTDEYGRTALHYAAGLGNLKIMAVILDRGANSNAADKLNCTPLHLGADNANSEIVKLLLSKGARKDRKDSLGRVPLFYAERVQNAVSAKLLYLEVDDSENSSATTSNSRIHAIETSDDLLSKKCKVDDLFNAWKSDRSRVTKVSPLPKQTKPCAVASAISEWKEIVNTQRTSAESSPLAEHASPDRVDSTVTMEYDSHRGQVSFSFSLLQLALQAIAAQRLEKDIFQCTEWEDYSKDIGASRIGLEYDLFSHHNLISPNMVL